jgi:hypothetical protein
MSVFKDQLHETDRFVDQDFTVQEEPAVLDEKAEQVAYERSIEQ